MTKDEIQRVVAEMSKEEVAALLRADAGKPFEGVRVIRKLRDKELLVRGRWEPSGDGRQVIDALSGLPYKAQYIAGVPEDEPERKKASGKHIPKPDVVVAHAVANRQSVCLRCKGKVEAGEKVIWIADEGLFHPDCVQEPS